MEFRLLGPVAVLRHGRPVPVPRRRERTVLAVLLLDAGRGVPPERLTAVLFDGEEPDRARQILQTAVSRLRRLLAETGAGAITFGPGGYTLAVDTETVDWHRFEALVARARRTAEPAERAEALRAALALWHGPALAGITDGPAAERLRFRLDESAASALELYAENELRLGHFASLADELGERVAAHPGRDRLVAAYMRALHHDGRTTAALEVFDAHRRHLADHFGLDPGGELRRLHTAILRGRVTPAKSTTPAPADSLASFMAATDTRVISEPPYLPPWDEAALADPVPVTSSGPASPRPAPVRHTGHGAVLGSVLAGAAHALGMERRFGEAHDLLDRAHEAVTGDHGPRPLASIALVRHHLNGRTGDHVRSLADGGQAIALASAAGDDLLLAKALTSYGHLCVHMGLAREAAFHLERALDLIDGEGLPYLESLIRDGLGLARHRLGDQSLALRHLSRSLSLTRSCGIPHRTAGVLLTLAETLHASGDAERARSAYRSSLELYRGIGHPAAGFVGGRLSLL